MILFIYRNLLTRIAIASDDGSTQTWLYKIIWFHHHLRPWVLYNLSTLTYCPYTNCNQYPTPQPDDDVMVPVMMINDHQRIPWFSAWSTCWSHESPRDFFLRNFWKYWNYVLWLQLAKLQRPKWYLSKDSSNHMYSRIEQASFIIQIQYLLHGIDDPLMACNLDLQMVDL
jgi:hypothetical protein